MPALQDKLNEGLAVFVPAKSRCMHARGARVSRRFDVCYTTLRAPRSLCAMRAVRALRARVSQFNFQLYYAARALRALRVLRARRARVPQY